MRLLVQAMALACAISITATSSDKPPAPTLWSASLAGLSYVPEVNSRSARNFTGVDVAIVATDQYVIVGFPLKSVGLQQRPPDSPMGVHAVRLVAFEPATGRLAWQQDVSAYVPEPDPLWFTPWWVEPFLWPVRGVGYAIRAPSSIDVYSDHRALVGRTPLEAEKNLVAVSPSGHTIATAIPGLLKVVPDDPYDAEPASSTLVTIDVLTGRQVAAVRSPYVEAVGTGDESLAFTYWVQGPESLISGVAVKRPGQPTKPLLKPTSEKLPDSGSFLSDSQVLVVQRWGIPPPWDPSDRQYTTLVRVDLARGKIAAERQLKGRIGWFPGYVEFEERLPWFWRRFTRGVGGQYLVFCGVGGRLFVLSHWFSWSKQEITVYDAKTLNEVLTVPLNPPPVVRAKAALTPDGSKLAVLADGVVTLYAIPTKTASHMH